MPRIQELAMSVDAPYRSQVTVTGMTCGHCTMSVTEEISEIDGVDSVDVDLPTGVVTVLSSRALSGEEIAAAVTEAGFAVV
jgi:copper chaperone CopZ